MSFTFIRGDLFESGADALVNPVNCIGVSGKGLALDFKRKYPINQQAYEAACAVQRLQLGRVLAVRDQDRWIINVPTKAHWRDESTLAGVRAGVQALTGEIRSRGIRSVAIPALGCGLGGLNWEDVRSVIVALFVQECPDVTVELYEPESATQPVRQELFIKGRRRHRGKKES